MRFDYDLGKEEKSLLAERAGRSFTANSCVYIELFVMETLNWNEVGRLLIRSPFGFVCFSIFSMSFLFRFAIHFRFWVLICGYF